MIFLFRKRPRKRPEVPWGYVLVSPKASGLRDSGPFRFKTEEEEEEEEEEGGRRRRRR